MKYMVMFFLQAEDGIRDIGVTGVQTCALPICSHERAAQATDDGRMSDELVPVTVASRKGETVVEVDEGPRRDTSLERLASLPGLVGKEGSHTAGNSPSVNDGAAALVLASDEWAEANGREALE